VAEQDSVHRALLLLSPRERAALVLHSVMGLSCAELAQALGISLSATKVTLWRARDHFRIAYLKEEGIDGD
jgi:DNA-directed RNA polymerase specialized sigma24 family protein